MRCPNLDELPSPPAGKAGWPWTIATPPCTLPNPPRITVVTPSLNQGQFLEETIRSVLLQGYPDLEYMVIDGGSTDESLAIIRRYERWLTYSVSQPDHGQSDAINQGWLRATGTIVAYLNADDTYCPNALTTVASTPPTGLVYGNCYVIDEQSRRLRRRTVRQATLADVLAWSPSILQPAMFLSLAALQSVGFLNENLHYTMDYDLCLRVMQKYPAQFIPAYLANMRGHAAAKTARQPAQHVLEGLHVAETFFQHPLPPALAQRHHITLALLRLRLARVYTWQNHRAEALHNIRRAWRLSRHPAVLRRSFVVLIMCAGSGCLPWLRSWKQRLLKKTVSQ